MKKFLVVAIMSSVVLSSCVSKKQYADLESKFGKSKQELVDAKANLMKCEIEKDKNTTLVSSLEQRVVELKKDKEKTLEFVGDLTVISKSASENIKETLAQMAKKDEYIHYIQNAMNAKDSLNLAIGFKLKSVLKDGLHDEDIQVNVEKTVVYISIADKLLFRSGSAIISDRATAVLRKVAKVVNAQPVDMEVMVEGYTDNISIRTAGIKDNWDLSVKRATAVVRILQNKFNVAPSRLVAAGRGEYTPIDSNDTVEGRAKNRRTRIVLMPKLDQFFDILNTKVGE